MAHLNIDLRSPASPQPAMSPAGLLTRENSVMSVSGESMASIVMY